MRSSYFLIEKESIPMREQIVESQPEGLWREIRAYSGRLRVRGDETNTRQHSELRRWKATGSQKAFWDVARNLGALCQQYATAYTLSIALRDYVQILEKNLADAHEEASAKPCGQPPIQLWKAGGEALVLSGVVYALTEYIERYQVGVFHVLAADGQAMAALGNVPPFQPLGPFPSLSDDLPDPYHQVITDVEHALEKHARALVKMELGINNGGIALALADRLLQYTHVQRVLFLTESSLLTMLRAQFGKATSLEDGQRLALLYPAQNLTTPLEADTCICFASLRQAQFHFASLRNRCEDEAEEALAACAEHVTAPAFDVVILYNVEHLSTLWAQLLATLDAPYLIGFSSTMSSVHCSLFQGVIITVAPPERESTGLVLPRLLYRGDTK